MKNAMMSIPLAFGFAVLSAGLAFAQTTSPAAYVYVQTTKGVVVYSATAAGKLTLVKGSPFAVAGQMEGDNGAYLISVGTDYLHTYIIESNGAVGRQAAQINTQSYGGAKCGTTDEAGSILDHTGKYFSEQLYGATYDGNTLCGAWQSYKIASSGQFTFLGDAESDAYENHDGAESIGISTVSSNDTFAYGIIGDVYADLFSAFRRNSAGELVTNVNFKETDPTSDPAVSDSNYFPLAVAADPANHLAVLMNEPFTNSPPPQLASYTINDTTGAIVSTNTWANMPSVKVTPTVIDMSPSGKLLAVGGAPGLQIFHFNGAAPLTPYSGVLLPKVVVFQLGWDKSNHLYALDEANGQLYVYTVTPTSISEASGPYTIANTNAPYWVTGMIVVPK